MPGHFSLSSGPPPPPALYEQLVQLLGPAAAAQFLGAAGAGGGGGGVAAQLAAAQALEQSVMAGQPPAAKHPVPNMGVPQPGVDTSSRDNLLGAADLLAEIGGGAAEPAAPPGGWTPAATPDTAPSNFLADLFGGQDASQNLLQFGLRMMAGSQPQPGATRGPGLLGAIGEAGVGTLTATAHRKAAAAEQDRRRRKEEPARQQASARAALSGGYDPTSDVTWNAGRAGMSPEQKRSLFAQGYPGQAGAQMAAQIFGGDPPSGYQNVEGGQEFITGGPADPAQVRRLAEAKRGPGGAERPAALQIADAYKAARAAAGKEVDDLEALKWAKSSVNDTRQETYTKIYTANRRDMLSDQESRKIADEITNYIHGSGFGSPAPASGPGVEPPPPGAEAPESLGWIERQLESLGLGGATAGPPTPGLDVAAARRKVRANMGRGEELPGSPTDTGSFPRRKPSLAGVKLPLSMISAGREPTREVEGPTRPIPRTAEGKVARTRLVIGQIYEAADGTRWRWGGQNFTEIR